MEIDTERTRSEYRSQLDSFMNCFIMTCSPFEERLEDLEREAEGRMGVTGWSWIEQAGGFCAYRRIDKIIDVHDPGFHPYMDIRLEPSNGMLTSNWFLWESRPCFEVPSDGIEALRKEYGEPTSSTFLDITGAQAQLDYLKQNTGGRILECYVFSAVNDFGKERWCYRFATEGYLRESVLLTQGFVLDYLLRHPLDCFYGPYIIGEPANMSACAGRTKMEILSPILEGYIPRIRERKARVDADIRGRGLAAERV